MKIGLCLSGGGARGAAHLGVIQALAEFDIYPNAVSGTSAGALIGILYCSGMSMDDMLAFSRKGGLMRTLKFGIPDRGIGNLNFLEKLLKNNIKQRNFEELEKELFVTATNLMQGRAETFSSGPLIEAVLASCAIPLVFSPIEFGGNIYVDGGTMDNFPVDPLLDKMDYIIGVNLLPRVHVGKKSLNSFIGVMGRTFDLSILGNAGPKLSQTHITISPIQLHHFGVFNFGKPDQLYKVGYEATLKVIDVIQAGLATIEESQSNDA